MATTEVAQMVCQFPGIADVNVYGVEVPMAEGRVGMASIKFKSSVRADEFSWQVIDIERYMASHRRYTRGCVWDGAFLFRHDVAIGRRGWAEERP